MKTALVTGATSGIGRAIAVELAAAGYGVLAAGRNGDLLHDLAADVPGVTPLVLDITDRKAVAAALDGLHVDVLVNNAGMMPPLGHFADVDIADIDAALAVNVAAVMVMTRLVAPQMRARGSGHILFTGSSAAHTVIANMALYSATKAAVSGFAAVLRADMSPHGVRVTEIVPGRVETGLYRQVVDEDVWASMYADHVAVQPEDVARMVAAVLALPPWADVTRFDIMPTRPTGPTGRK